MENEDFSRLVFRESLLAKMPTKKESALWEVTFGYEEATIDGFCIHCKRDSTFKRSKTKANKALYSIGASKPSGRARDEEDNPCLIKLECMRDPSHAYWVVILAIGESLQKIGQYPPLATIEYSTLKRIDEVISKTDRDELARANGLASHGVGIGAFVYLRRIFERLIHARFQEVKGTLGLTEDDFKVRMDEKIEILNQHLPDVLVQNKKLYAILSYGIHELEEKECIDFFPVARASIQYILEELERVEKKRAMDDAKKEIDKYIGAKK
jgi:hypothetical protein